MFSGVGTALITPFDQNFNVDYDALRNIVHFQLNEKINALIVLGTTGESPVINEVEREKIIATVQEETERKIPVIVGTGTNDTAHVVKLNKIAEKHNADGLLIVNPYYNKGTQESITAHYKYISERTVLPIMLYNVPSRTGMNLLPETAIKIHESCTNVVAIKEASGNISQISNLFAIKPETLQVYSGNDDQTLPIMALGGKGVISVFSNAYPSEMKKLTSALINEDIHAAQQLNRQYLSMMNSLFIETSPGPVKYLMSRLNLCQNVLRLPLGIISGKTEKIIDEEMYKLSKQNALSNKL